MAQTWKEKYDTNEEEVTGSAVGITAFAGGGQADATNLISKFNSVDTVATGGDSVKLVAALIGKQQSVFNNTGNTLSIFPQADEFINGVINFEFLLPSGQAAFFISNATLKWTAL